MMKRSMGLLMGVVVGCQVADPSPATVPVGGSGGASSAGVGNGGVASNTAGNGGAAGTGASTAGSSGALADAGAGGHTDAPSEGGAAGAGTTSTEGGAAGEASTPGGCTPTCSSTQTCVLSACKDQDCMPNASLCSGSSLRKCSADGLSSVEVTTCNDGKYCDSDSASCKQGFPTCPNIYLGSGRFGANQLPVWQANDGIALISYDVQVNTVVFGQMRVNNLGTDNSPITHMELYLSEAPGFPTNPNRLILQQDASVPGAAQGGTPGEYTIPWSYTFSTLGHYVLLARVENNSPPTGAACTQQGYDTSSPATNAQTAIHYLNVVE